MSWKPICVVTCLGFVTLAVVAHRDMPKPAVCCSASDRAALEEIIEQVRLPEIRKMKPIAMPSKKGIHWVSLAKAAAATPSEGMEDVYKKYYQQRRNAK